MPAKFQREVQPGLRKKLDEDEAAAEASRKRKADQLVVQQAVLSILRRQGVSMDDIAVTVGTSINIAITKADLCRKVVAELLNDLRNTVRRRVSEFVGGTCTQKIRIELNGDVLCY